MNAATADLMDAHPDAAVCTPGLRSYGGHPAFAGQAQTVVAPEDNTLVRSTLETPGEGRVLVVDGGGSLQCALLGDNLAKLAVDNGWVGVIVHGAIRDAAIMAELPVGVLALATMPRKSIKADRGSVGDTVDVLGVTIAPGDWVYADTDGVVVSPEPLHP